MSLLAHAFPLMNQHVYVHNQFDHAVQKTAPCLSVPFWTYAKFLHCVEG